MSENTVTIAVPKRGSKWQMKNYPNRRPSIVKDVRYGSPSGDCPDCLAVHWEHLGGWDYLDGMLKDYVPFFELSPGQTYSGTDTCAKVVSVDCCGTVTFVNPVTTTLVREEFLRLFPNLTCEK